MTVSNKLKKFSIDAIDINKISNYPGTNRSPFFNGCIFYSITYLRTYYLPMYVCVYLKLTIRFKLYYITCSFSSSISNPTTVKSCDNNSRATAAPIPDPDPVITATLFRNRSISKLLFEYHIQ